MLICGLKLTHDGSIALIEDGELKFSIEMEKLRNNPRYTSIEDTAIIEEVLNEFNYKVEDVSFFSLDGWGGFNQDSLAVQPRLRIGDEFNFLSAENQGSVYELALAQYRERSLKYNVMERWKFDGLKIGKSEVSYNSYLHVMGHIASAYCTSPFARNNQGSYVVVWDGGMFPRMYYVDIKNNNIENFGPLFLLIGNVYTIFSQHFGPFKTHSTFAKDDLSIAGKVMAYIALGKCRPELFDSFDEVYDECYDTPMGFANLLAKKFKELIKGKGFSDEDILATFHVYLENILIEKIKKKIKRNPREDYNLCFAGGCALNIKWNSTIRNSGIFNEVYVPPFPNDSGSAIGAACAEWWLQTGKPAIKWDVYSGPMVKGQANKEGWKNIECSVKELAHIFHSTQEPVVVLNGRAELGPRALGSRSIMGAATSTHMKDILNKIKKRESYRPVSPICLEQDATEIFDPGTPDQYMLFDHKVNADWLEKIPAICHLDGSARLQTVNLNQNQVITELLEEYKSLSGVPMLCNTSANLNGKGFFPDINSVLEWGEVNYVWSDNVLYEKLEKIDFHEDVLFKTESNIL